MSSIKDEKLADEKRIREEVDKLLNKIANSTGGKIVKYSSEKERDEKAKSFNGTINLAKYMNPHELLAIKQKNYIGGKNPTIEEWERLNKKKWQY